MTEIHTISMDALIYAQSRPDGLVLITSVQQPVAIVLELALKDVMKLAQDALIVLFKMDGHAPKALLAMSYVQIQR